MRIRVTTSINVRSNTVPPSPIQVNDDFPQPEEREQRIEKTRSKSPIPFLPPLQDMAMSRFKASQRPPTGSRLSAWLHGASAMNDDRGRPRAHNRKISHTSTYCYHQTPRRRSAERPTGLRPAASTRGVIDPVHSPTAPAWPMPPQGHHTRNQQRPLSPVDAYQTRMLAEMGFPPSKTRHRKGVAKPLHIKHERKCFPHIADRKIRQKAIGCVFFGTLLTIILTICTSLIS